MKSIIFISFLMVVVLGGWPVVAGQGDEAQNLEVVKTLMDEGWNQKKAEVFDRLIAPNCIYYVNGELKEQIGPAYSRFAVTQNEANFPGFSMITEEVFAAGDKVVLRYLFKGVFQKLDKSVTLHAAMIMQLEKGKIIKSWTYDNQMEIYKQLGFKLMPPTAVDSSAPQVSPPPKPVDSQEKEKKKDAEKNKEDQGRGVS